MLSYEISFDKLFIFEKYCITITKPHIFGSCLQKICSDKCSQVWSICYCKHWLLIYAKRNTTTAIRMHNGIKLHSLNNSTFSPFSYPEFYHFLYK